MIISTGIDNEEGKITYGHKEAFAGDEYVRYPDCGIDFTGMCLCQNLVSYMLSIWVFYYTPVKLSKRVTDYSRITIYLYLYSKN